MTSTTQAKRAAAAPVLAGAARSQAQCPHRGCPPRAARRPRQLEQIPRELMMVPAQETRHFETVIRSEIFRIRSDGVWTDSLLALPRAKRMSRSRRSNTSGPQCDYVDITCAVNVATMLASL